MKQGFLLLKLTWYYCNMPLGILYREIFHFSSSVREQSQKLGILFYNLQNTTHDGYIFLSWNIITLPMGM